MMQTERLSLARTLAERYGAMPGVRAVVLGGSLTSEVFDDRSDIDLYVYAETPPPLPLRAALAGHSPSVEIDNRFWETGDEWEDQRTGIAIDVTYRPPAWVEEELDKVLVHHQASTGYSTAIWHNVANGLALVDTDDWHSELAKRAASAFPDELRRAIVAKNWPILGEARSSYREQIAKALGRGDRVSVNHRITALLESVFDIVFAVNRQTHPGEKRLVDWVERTCPRRPRDFADSVLSVLSASVESPDTLLDCVDGLLAGLHETLGEERLLAASDVSLDDLATA